MDPIIGGALIGGGASILGGLLGGHQQHSSAVEQQRLANEFSEKAYKHRHQWQVEDLKKAGLNPMLSAIKGAPSAPSGATASGAKYDYDTDVIGKVASAVQVKNLKAQNRAIEADADKARTEADRAKAELDALQDPKNWDSYIRSIIYGQHPVTSAGNLGGNVLQQGWDWVKQDLSNTAKTIKGWGDRFDAYMKRPKPNKTPREGRGSDRDTSYNTQNPKKQKARKPQRKTHYY